jgi:hypothetical protein
MSLQLHQVNTLPGATHPVEELKLTIAGFLAALYLY